MEIQAGASLTKDFTVTKEHLALVVQSGSLPVLATPALAAFMECTASLLLQDALDAGWTTVGTDLHIQHTAPTLSGQTVTCRAALTHVEGRTYTFQIEAWDDADVIGCAEHKRVSVLSERFMDKARKRTEEKKA